ncbi:M20 aminoacylase family protein [Falsiroseomonas sp. HW251]|uniref:M20 aminoacylase family protein n=1 Tax=Falsiroseomonas sp. HW251 TaxID=3390998 RepID=UPI003D31B30F
MPILNRIAAFTPEMQAWRQDIHAHPELAFEEHRTSDLVARRLAEWGIEVHRGLAGTGVIGVLRNGTSSRAIGLRADMDALPMPEETGLPYASRNPGRMHACGHDGHTSMLLGAAKYLAETKAFDGTVVFIFQPAEEAGGGGERMVQDGLFRRFPVEQVFALHNDPTTPIGQAQAVAGPVLAAADPIAIRIRGKGAHAAQPHFGVDPILVGAQMITALHQVVSRRIDPLDSAVLSLCVFQGGTVGNVIPETATIEGTVRTLRVATRDEMERIITKTVAGLAALHDAEAELDYRRGYPPTVNDAAATDRAALAASRVLGEGRVIREALPLMGAEDFSYMLLERPGCFLRLGQADGAKGAVACHNPRYDFNDDALPVGASWFATLVEQEMPRS